MGVSVPGFPPLPSCPFADCLMHKASASFESCGPALFVHYLANSGQATINSLSISTYGRNFSELIFGLFWGFQRWWGKNRWKGRWKQLLLMRKGVSLPPSPAFPLQYAQSTKQLLFWALKHRDQSFLCLKSFHQQHIKQEALKRDYFCYELGVLVGSWKERPIRSAFHKVSYNSRRPPGFTWRLVTLLHHSLSAYRYPSSLKPNQSRVLRFFLWGQSQFNERWCESKVLSIQKNKQSLFHAQRKKVVYVVCQRINCFSRHFVIFKACPIIQKCQIEWVVEMPPQTCNT